MMPRLLPVRCKFITGLEHMLHANPYFSVTDIEYSHFVAGNKFVDVLDQENTQASIINNFKKLAH